MIDSHCHLADDAFRDDLDAVIVRAQTSGLTRVICVLAADSDGETDRSRHLVDKWPAIRFAVGLHPHQAGQFAGRESDVEALVRRRITAMPETRALGEIGLDYHYDFAPRDVQQQVFRVQIRLARELDLPVVIHTREAEDDTLAILKEEAGDAVRGVMHCFTGTPSLARESLALGMHLSFAGIVTFPKGGNVREIAVIVPPDRILCETDSPYLAPTPHRGKRNEPSFVVRVAEELAALRNEPLEQLHSQLVRNFDALFRP